MSPGILNKFFFVKDGQQIQIKAKATFLVIFGAHMNILSIVTVKIWNVHNGHVGHSP